MPNFGATTGMLNTYTVRIFNKVDHIGKDSIDSISDDPFFTYEWFKTLETSKPIKSNPLYLTVYNHNGLEAFLPCFLDSPYTYFIYRPYLPFMRHILNLGKKLRVYEDHVLICYSPFCHRSKILFRSDFNRELILDLLSNTIDDICRTKRILFSSFEFISENDRFLMTHLQNYGYLKFPWWQDSMSIDIKWSNFQNYLTSLKHKTRLNVRREIKKFRESGTTIEELSDFGHLSSVISDLYSNLLSKYNRKKESPYDANFFKKLNTFGKEKAKVFVATKNKEILGFCLSLRHRDVLDCYMCGFNYDFQTNTDFIYFNLVYYEPIKWAIEEGIKKINYRISAEEAKLRRGCKKEKIFSFVKCHNKGIKTSLRLYTLPKRKKLRL